MNQSSNCLLNGRYTTLAEATRKAVRTRPSRDHVKPKLPIDRKAKHKGVGLARDPSKYVYCLECGRKTLNKHLALQAGWECTDGGRGRGKKAVWTCYKCQVFKFVRANTKKKDMACSDTTPKSASP